MANTNNKIRLDMLSCRILETLLSFSTPEPKLVPTTRILTALGMSAASRERGTADLRRVLRRLNKFVEMGWVERFIEGRQYLWKLTERGLQEAIRVSQEMGEEIPGLKVLPYRVRIIPVAAFSKMLPLKFVKNRRREGILFEEGMRKIGRLLPESEAYALFHAHFLSIFTRVLMEKWGKVDGFFDALFGEHLRELLALVKGAPGGREPRILIIRGPYGSGKSYLLFYAYWKILREIPDVVAVYISPSTCQSLSDMYYRILGEMSKHDRIKDLVKKFMESYGSVSGVEGVVKGLGALMGRLVRARAIRRLVLMIDEFLELPVSSEGEVREILQFIESIIRKRVPLTSLVITTTPSTFEKLSSELPYIFGANARIIDLKPLDQYTATTLLLKIVSEVMGRSDEPLRDTITKFVKECDGKVGPMVDMLLNLLSVLKPEDQKAKGGDEESSSEIS
ncbi:MAG: hypothetical protein ACTSXJ_09650 [Candidatus Baldrarchaeia archaeon]